MHPDIHTVSAQYKMCYPRKTNVRLVFTTRPRFLANFGFIVLSQFWETHHMRFWSRCSDHEKCVYAPSPSTQYSRYHKIGFQLDAWLSQLSHDFWRILTWILFKQFWEAHLLWLCSRFFEHVWWFFFHTVVVWFVWAVAPSPTSLCACGVHACDTRSCNHQGFKKRTLHIRKRVLFILNRALSILTRALSIRKRAQNSKYVRH